MTLTPDYPIPASRRNIERYEIPIGKSRNITITAMVMVSIYIVMVRSRNIMECIQTLLDKRRKIQSMEEYRHKLKHTR